MIFALVHNFMSTYLGCLNNVLNMKALVGIFNQETLVGAFSVFMKTYCETDRMDRLQH